MAAPAKKHIGPYVIGSSASHSEKNLGQGTFGKVKLATHTPTGELVAIKILEKSKINEVSDIERVSRELHILKLMRHPHIIQLYEVVETPKYLFLVMEYCPGGDLFDYICSRKKYSLFDVGSRRRKRVDCFSKCSAVWNTYTSSRSSTAISSLRTC